MRGAWWPAFLSKMHPFFATTGLLFYLILGAVKAETRFVLFFPFDARFHFHPKNPGSYAHCQQQKDTGMTLENRTKRSATQPYNGHPNWNLWNVSLWISSDESTYFHCMGLIKELGVKRAVDALHAQIGDTQTPDGARYTKTALRHALRGIAD
jgi:hypothetical protein